MATTTIRNDVLRDGRGRPHTAPAWTGNITALTRDQLHDRIEAIGAHIGRLATEWQPSTGWSIRHNFATEVAPWAEMRLCCLREYDRRDETVGGA